MALSDPTTRRGSGPAIARSARPVLSTAAHLPLSSVTSRHASRWCRHRRQRARAHARRQRRSGARPPTSSSPHACRRGERRLRPRRRRCSSVPLAAASRAPPSAPLTLETTTGVRRAPPPHSAPSDGPSRATSRDSPAAFVSAQLVDTRWEWLAPTSQMSAGSLPPHESLDAVTAAADEKPSPVRLQLVMPVEPLPTAFLSSGGTAVWPPRGRCRGRRRRPCRLARAPPRPPLRDGASSEKRVPGVSCCAACTCANAAGRKCCAWMRHSTRSRSCGRGSAAGESRHWPRHPRRRSALQWSRQRHRVCTRHRPLPCQRPRPSCARRSAMACPLNSCLGNGALPVAAQSMGERRVGHPPVQQRERCPSPATATRGVARKLAASVVRPARLTGLMSLVRT